MFGEETPKKKKTKGKLDEGSNARVLDGLIKLRQFAEDILQKNNKDRE
jgi:hypothetical protein